MTIGKMTIGKMTMRKLTRFRKNQNCNIVNWTMFCHTKEAKSSACYPSLGIPPISRCSLWLHMPPEAYSDGSADAIMSRLVKVFRCRNVIFVRQGYQRRHSKTDPDSPETRSKNAPAEWFGIFVSEIHLTIHRQARPCRSLCRRMGSHLYLSLIIWIVFGLLENQKSHVSSCYRPASNPRLLSSSSRRKLS